MDQLRTMESFVRVARSGSFTTAAQQLGLSRALVSRHITYLETRLGVRLVNRTTRCVNLTDEGASYLDVCEQIFRDIERSEQALFRAQNEPAGTLKVAATKSFGALNLADAVIAFAQSQPRVRVSLILDDFSFRPYDFIEKGFDVTLRTTAIRDSALIARQLGWLNWIVCASPGYLAREGAPRSPAELPHRPCLVHINFNPNDRIWRFDGPSGRKSIKIDGPFLSNSALVLRKAVLEGLGIALLPRYCVAGDLAAGTLVPLLPRHVIPPRPLLAVYPREVLVPQKVTAFVAFLARWFQSADPNGGAAQSPDAQLKARAGLPRTKAA